ncbi:hypothetical protein Tco_0168603 [Tanacetum coccineum]
MKIMVGKTPWLEQRLQVTLEPSFGLPGGKTDAKLGSVDGGFVASVVGGGVDVDCCGGRVKDDNDCGMTVENTGEESEITETGTVRSVGVLWLGTS